jgi:5-methylcytosine-specific restriction endonuclease McrA
MVSVGEPSEGTGESVHPEAEPELVTGDVSVEGVLRLLEVQQYRCALTGRSLTPQAAALDHIVPVRFGGRHVIENAQVLHKDVNRAKGSLTNEEFIGMCREVVHWSDLPNTRKESQ